MEGMINQRKVLTNENHNIDLILGKFSRGTRLIVLRYILRTTILSYEILPSKVIRHNEIYTKIRDFVLLTVLKRIGDIE